MPRMGDLVSEQDVHDIQAYIIERAKQDRAEGPPDVGGRLRERSGQRTKSALRRRRDRSRRAGEADG